MIFQTPASDLQQGDIVHAHGMMVLLDRPVQTIKDPNSHGGEFAHCRGLVLNVEALDDPWLVGMTREHHEWPNRHVPTGEHRWTIQSNDLVSWTVEREAV